MKAHELAQFIEENSPAPLDGDEYGHIYGDKNKIIKNVAFVWRLSVSKIEEIAQERIDIIISHEAVFQKEIDSKWSINTKHFAVEYNANLKKKLEINNIVVYRYHSNFDAWPNIGVADYFGKHIGFLHETGRGKFTRIYDIPNTTPQELANSLKSRLNCPVRIIGNPHKIIKKIATMIGGFGANQHLMPFEISEHAADAVIVGDLTEKIMLNALELNMPIIETLHSVTEEPSLKKIMQFCATNLTELNFKFYYSGANLWT